MNLKTIFGGVALFSLAGLVMIGVYGVRQQQSTAPRAQTTVGGGGASTVGGSGGGAVVGSGPGVVVPTTSTVLPTSTAQTTPISANPTGISGGACGPRVCDLNSNNSCGDDVASLRQIINQLSSNPALCAAGSGRDCSMFDTNGDGAIDDADVSYCQASCSQCGSGGGRGGLLYNTFLCVFCIICFVVCHYLSPPFLRVCLRTK